MIGKKAVILLCWSAFFLAAVISWGEEKEIKSITAVRCNPSAPVIDGFVNDPVWELAPRFGGFTQEEPEEGVAPTESTTVQVVYDDEAVYVAFTLYDSQPDKIVARLTRRDRWVESDFVRFGIDSYHDHLTGFYFQTNAAGVQRDGCIYKDTWTDGSWDGVWQSEVQIVKDGWTAEFKIPYSCLRFAKSDSLAWGINFGRWISRKSEYDIWVYVPEEEGGFVSRFGHLDGLKNIKPPRRFEFLPYAVSSENTEPKRPGNADGRDFFSNIGMDLKYGISSDLTLDAAINPDFGQVESDATVLNLSTFETYYEEKRPFFLEGNTIFDTPFDLFYSRRIGKKPSTDLDDEADYIIDQPTTTTILSALKLSGRTRGGTSIGVMNAVTQEERASYMDTLGVKREIVIEPSANYNVIRLKQDIFTNSSVGIMTTAVNQKQETPAYTGGIDWDLHFPKGIWVARGQVVASRTGRDEHGGGFWAGINKDAGEHVRGSVWWEYESRNFDINRLGFIGRGNYNGGGTWWQYRTYKDWHFIRETYHNLNYWNAWNLDGYKISHGGNYNNSIRTTGNWWFGGGYGFQIPYYDDRETRGGPPYKRPRGWDIWMWLDSDTRKGWVVHLHHSFGTNWDGIYESYSAQLEIQPRSNLEFSIGPSYNANYHVSRWVETVEDSLGDEHYVFGELSSREFDINFRSTLTLTKNLSLQLWVQACMAIGDYENFKLLDSPGSFKPLGDVEYSGNLAYNTYEDDPDFNWKSLNANLVLRWEYRPGSTIYLVWTQFRDEDENYGHLPFDEGLKDVWNLSANNTFLIKANYWWSL